MITISCLRQEIISGPNRYPVFVGFASAADILQLAEAPAFSPHTSHSDISNNILTPPVKDWQRPLNDARVHAISCVYNDSGELMPNPVLLCENVLLSHSNITIAQQLSGAIPTNIWQVQIGLSQQGTPKPLWILDGQHRINGLAASAQRNNAIPVVLLLNQNAHAYSGPLVAKLFAQVTTAAAPLDELHDEWLTFAFKLRTYANSNPGAPAEAKAMQAVAELCRKPTFGGNVANPFHNQIRFNDHSSASCGPLPGGFHYDCVELKEIIHRGYYAVSSPSGGHLAPEQVAEQVALAFIALTQKVAAPQQDSVFFGDSKHEQRIMQDAYLFGVLQRIIALGARHDWAALLDALKFPVTNWNFSWVGTLNGAVGKISRDLAINVLVTAFKAGALPTASGTLSDYLKGNDAELEIAFSPLTPTGRPSKAGRTPLVVRNGSSLSPNISPALHFKVVRKSGNIGKLEIMDQQSPPGNILYYKDSGERVDDPSTGLRCAKPLKLIFRMHHYGGVTNDAKLEITW